jgi:hypothetical protein
MGNKGGKDKSLGDSKKGKGAKPEATQTAKKAEKIDINGKGLDKFTETYVVNFLLR